MDRQEAERWLHAIAPEIAAALGCELAARDDDHVVEMLHPEGFKLFFNAGWSGGYDKISIGSSWPLDEDRRQVTSSYDASIPRINVSVTRTPEAIAREVERRFLPEWKPLWEKSLARLDSSRKHEGETKSNAAELAEIVGIDPSEIDKNGRFSLYRSSIFPESISEVKVSGDSVTLEIHCDVENAREILRALVRLAG
jgi:hypothetical protein